MPSWQVLDCIRFQVFSDIVPFFAGFLISLDSKILFTSKIVLRCLDQNPQCLELQEQRPPTDNPGKFQPQFWPVENQGSNYSVPMKINPILQNLINGESLQEMKEGDFFLPLELHYRLQIDYSYFYLFIFYVLTFIPLHICGNEDE